MSRTNKRSRLRGLPPRLQLIEREATTGSFPTTSRVSSDNRTGRYYNPWDDQNVIDFQSYGSVPNTWKDNLALYVKLSEDTLVKDSDYQKWVKNQQSGRLNFTASYINPWFRTFYTPTDPILISFNTNDQSAFSGSLRMKGDQGLTFNEFGKLDFMPNIPQYRTTADNPYWTGLQLQNPDPGFQDTPLSATAWVKIFELGDTESTIMRKGQNAVEFDFLITTDSVLQVNLYSNSTSNYIRAETAPLTNLFKPVTTSSWVHVGFTYASSSFDASDLNLYVNGQWTSSSYTTGGTWVGIINGSEDLFFGCKSAAADPNYSDQNLGGTMNEIAIFNKGLSATEMEAIYNCRSSLIVEEQGGVVYPIGLNTQSRWIDNTEFTSSMIVPNAKVVKGAGDTFVHFSPGQELTAYRDHDLPAVDGKSFNDVFYATGSSVVDAGEGFQQPLWSKSVIEFDYEVVYTGSVGYRSASNSTTEGPDHAMMYFDPTMGRFFPVGSPNSWEYYQEIYDSFSGILGVSEASQLAMQTYLLEKANGFLPFVPNVANSQLTTYLSQAPISEFGFPFDDKYHVPFTGTSASVLVPLSDKIDKPFIAEKIVVEFSCSHFSRDYWAQGTGGAHGEAINTFFVLNQRKMKNYFSGTIAPKIDLATGTTVQTTYILPFAATTSSLDLVSFNQFAFLAAQTASVDTDTSWIAATQALRDRNIQYVLCGQDNDWERIRFDYTGSFVLSGTVNMPYPTQDVQRTIPTIIDGDSIRMTVPGPAGTTAGSYNSLQYPGFYGGRSGLAQYGNVDTRNLLRNAVGVERRVSQDKILGTDKSFPKLQQATPYILQPSDNLIFGFNCAYIGASEYTDAFPFTSSSVNRGPTLTILPGKFKIRIYGSTVVEGEEHHDTLNQLLTSNTIHEVIE